MCKMIDTDGQFAADFAAALEELGYRTKEEEEQEWQAMLKEAADAPEV